MKALARSFVWWRGLDQDIEMVAAKCDKCKVTASMPATVPWHPWQHRSSPWDRIHVDFGEWNQKHFLVVVDAVISSTIYGILVTTDSSLGTLNNMHTALT